MRKITIGHDNSGGSPAWYLDTIIVKNLNNKKKWVVPVKQWISDYAGSSTLRLTKIIPLTNTTGSSAAALAIGGARLLSATAPTPVTAEGDHVLRLIALHCVATEDWTGADNPYLLVNNQNWWGGTLNDGNIANLDSVPLIRFHQRVDIELLEGDAGVLDDDDHLGTHVVQASQLTDGERTAYFSEDDSRYNLTYVVVK